MKKVVSLLTVVLLVFAMISLVYADAETKLKDGVKQLVTSPRHVVECIKEEYEAADFKPFGVAGGFAKGVFYSLKDVGLGLLNTFTFFVDNE